MNKKHLRNLLKTVIEGLGNSTGSSEIEVIGEYFSPSLPKFSDSDFTSVLQIANQHWVNQRFQDYARDSFRAVVQQLVSLHRNYVQHSKESHESLERLSVSTDSEPFVFVDLFLVCLQYRLLKMQVTEIEFHEQLARLVIRAGIPALHHYRPQDLTLKLLEDLEAYEYLWFAGLPNFFRGALVPKWASEQYFGYLHPRDVSYAVQPGSGNLWSRKASRRRQDPFQMAYDDPNPGSPSAWISYEHEVERVAQTQLWDSEPLAEEPQRKDAAFVQQMQVDLDQLHKALGLNRLEEIPNLDWLQLNLLDTTILFNKYLVHPTTDAILKNQSPEEYSLDTAVIQAVLRALEFTKADPNEGRLLLACTAIEAAYTLLRCCYFFDQGKPVSDSGYI